MTHFVLTWEYEQTLSLLLSAFEESAIPGNTVIRTQFQREVSATSISQDGVCRKMANSLVEEVRSRFDNAISFL